MRLRKLTKSEREWIREQRKETQLIIARARQQRFHYIVNPPEIPRICFGTTMERETLPMSGPALTPFMRLNTAEMRVAPGPSDYLTSKSIGKMFPSKLGFSVFASKTPRLPSSATSPYPPIGTYTLDKWNPIIQSLAPFGSCTKRCEEPKFLTPGPPTYPYHVPRRQMQLCTSFGSHRTIWPEVAVVCTPQHSAKCFKCGQIPYGDYWRDFKGNRDMCRPCMKKEEAISKHCSTDNIQRVKMQREHEKYTQTRYCGFYHAHNDTTAAVQTMSTKTLHKKINLENYLMMFSGK